MKSLAFTVKLEERLKQQRVEDPRWYERAACNGVDFANFETGEDEAPNVIYEAMRYCSVCPVRRDCVVDAVRKGDTGVIRGGVRFGVRMPTSRCRQCKLPVASKGKRCTFCSMLRKCVDCQADFTARYAWLFVERCVTCRGRHANELRRIKMRRVRKPS